ncbi:MAG: pilin [Candidatus Moranbacteria bacterium]|nr:pilin [Candidatus Moranbacteria bacterium]
MKRNTKIFGLVLFGLFMAMFVFSPETHAAGLTDVQCAAKQDRATCQQFDPGTPCVNGGYIKLDTCTDLVTPAKGDMPELTYSRNCCVAKPTSASGGLNYQLLEKIPGTDGLGSDLPGYIKAIYKIALIVVTLSAVLMITIGGFMYLTSAGNTAAMSSAKSVIADALIGLVIALAAWLVLYVINPDLVNVSLTTLPPIAVSSSTKTAPTALPRVQPGVGLPPSAAAVQLAKDILALGNVTLAGNGSCSSLSGQVTPKKNIQDVAAGKTMAACIAGPSCASQGTSGCADNIVRPSETMLNAIKTVGQTKQFTITSIAGGPHALKSNHYTGQAIDIAPVTQALLDAFVAAGAAAPAGNASSMCEKSGINVGCSGNGANHIHLVFP